MAQRPLAPTDKHSKVFFGSTFRVLESPHASPCLSFASSPTQGYAFNPMPLTPLTLGELPPSMPSPASLPSAPTPQIRPGGSVLDMLPSPTWQVCPDSETIGLTRQRSGSPGPKESSCGSYACARPKPMPLGSPMATVPTSPPSPVFTRQMSPPCSPAFTRQFSPPGSPAWTTVSNPRRKPAMPGAAHAVPVRTGPPPQGQQAPEPKLQRLPTAGDSVDLYYDQKEMFVKGWTKEAKSTRSVKQKKRVDYQVDKRRQQSQRDRAAMADDFDDSDPE